MVVPFAVKPARPLGKGASGTFARPPPGIAARLNNLFVPRKMEFKGWVTDYKRCCLEGVTATEVTKFIGDLQKMVPKEFHKHIDWDQTRTEQGNWPTKTWPGSLGKIGNEP